MPRAYNDKILSSKPAQRVWCLGISWGSKLPCRSRGISIGSSPNSPLSVLRLRPLRAGRVGDWLVLVVTEVLGHLRIQRPLHQQLGQLLEQAVLADQVFRLLVVGQQAAEQLVGYLVLAWAHGVSGSKGSFLPVARLHKI